MSDHPSKEQRFVRLSNGNTYALGSYTKKAVEVLALVAQGTAYAGRNKAGRGAHLNWLHNKGLVTYGSERVGEGKWSLTDFGREILRVENGN